MKNIWKQGKIAVVFAACSILVACGQDSGQKVSELHSFSPAAKASSQWSAKVGNGTGKNYLKLEPVVTKNFVYASDVRGHVFAIDRSNGKVKWRTSLDQEISSGVGVGNGVVAVGTQTGHVYALDENTGKTIWSARITGEILASPSIDNNKIFVKSQSGRLFAFDATTGQKLWSFRTQNPSLVLRSDSKVTVAKGLAISGFADGSVIAFEQDTGKDVWHIQLAIPHGASSVERMVDITADPVVEDDVMYITSYQGQIAAVNVSNGDIVWKKDFSTYAGLTVGPNAVFATDESGKVWAFNKQNGMVLWHNDDLEGRDLSGPSYGEGKIVVGDKQGYAHWMSAEDGHFLARDRVARDTIYTAPLTLDGHTYFYTSRGRLVSYIVS